MKKITRAVIICAAVGALFITGCATVTSFLTPSSAAPAKGETASITGRLEKDKNHYILTDAKSGVSYRFVGLKKADAAQLSLYVGKSVTVKLKVKSTESAKANIAEFVAIVK
ncbi:MAG: hypothetical protein NTU62_11370 [Spirochaetes bacterium]|nr:hypothetical protein [Spirochaetota bacterium]